MTTDNKVILAKKSCNNNNIIDDNVGKLEKI